ncbi:MAG TPA: hypothetical protein VLA12_09460, partial [Planctomycetaceae bacterium]|nr:hypothetical protein [Planctomycetaceae bacterium]
MLAPAAHKKCIFDTAARNQFEAMLPTLQEQISYRFRRCTRELREELEAEALALAFEMLVRLVRRGKTELATPTPLA